LRCSASSIKRRFRGEGVEGASSFFASEELEGCEVAVRVGVAGAVAVAAAVVGWLLDWVSLSTPVVGAGAGVGAATEAGTMRLGGMVVSGKTGIVGAQQCEKEDAALAVGFADLAARYRGNVKRPSPRAPQGTRRSFEDPWTMDEYVTTAKLCVPAVS